MNENNSTADAHALSDAAASLRGFLLFRSGARRFALPDSVVLEIVTAGVVSPLPFTPSWVEGLANIGGRILPQASLSALLGDAASAVKGELVVLCTARAQCALHVDEVLARIEIPAAEVQDFLAGEEGQEHAYVAGEFRYEGRVVLLLDSNRLGELFSAREVPEGRPGLLGNPEAAHGSEKNDGLACLRFQSGGESYAMALSQVGEIIACADITLVPGAPALVAGITTLRDEPLLMVSLARLLGLSATSADGARETSALVLEQGDLRIGLLVDAVSGMSVFAEAALRLFHDTAGDVAGVLHDETGIVIGLLDTARLFRPEREMQLSAFMPARRQQQREQVRIVLPHLQVLLGREAFGIPLDIVQRIVAWHPQEAVSDEQGRIAGVVNVEGEVLPVLATERLHESACLEKPSAWVVVGRAGQHWALAVDEASAIVPVAEDSLEKIGSGSGLVSAVARVGDSLLSIVSFASLLEAA